MNKTSNATKVRVCPVCRATITAGKVAMRQHLLQHGQSVPMPRKRVSRPKKSAARPGSGRTVSGTDVVTVFTINTRRAKVGDVICDLQLNPFKLIGTRLNAEAKLWARWKPIKIAFSVKPAASVVISGAYMAGWTPDPTETLPGGAQSVTRVATYQKNVMARISEERVINVPATVSRAWYIMDSQSPEDSDHGSFLVVLASDLTGFDGNFSISIMMDWKVSFDGPEIKTRNEETLQIFADPGYEYYFTDSSSDWQGGQKLTLKHKEGGYVVPFSRALPEFVYELSPAVKLTYYKSDGSAGQIRYGVAAKDYGSYTILAVFDDLEKARNYAKTGDVQFLLPYSKAGDWVSQANPPWTMLQDRNTVYYTNRSVPPKSELESRLDKLEMMLRRLLPTSDSSSSSSSGASTPKSEKSGFSVLGALGKKKKVIDKPGPSSGN